MMRRALLVLPLLTATLFLAGARPQKPPPPPESHQPTNREARCMDKCQEPAEKCITRCGSKDYCIERCTKDLAKCSARCSGH